MARLESQEIDDIISRDKPGFKVIRRGRRGRRAAIESDTHAAAGGGLELDELRRRYLGDGASVVGDEQVETDDESDDETDDEVVVVEPDARPGFETAPGPKTVIISGKDRRVIAEQG